MITASKLGLKLSKSRASVLALAAFLNCSPDLTDDPIPPATFADIFINLNLPENLVLNTDGNSKYFNGGVRGIIVHRVNASTYRAFERNCSFQPNEACATVGVHISTLYMEDSCCGSTFNFNGDPTGGPAWRPLRQYQTILSGNELTVTDEVVN
ncbi:MAG: hypothetical protein HRU69_05560 [Flammeovirgaceae bacterium]|nr:MAG: hypothetical protein HRU69_05560 [Flammeovirgaceae bacterium]